MKKITICLPSEYYIKYLDYDAFKSLKEKYEVNFLINKNKFVNKTKIRKENYFEYSLSKNEHIKYMRIIHLGFARYQNRSESFRWVMKRWYPNLFNYFSLKYPDYITNNKKEPGINFYLKLIFEYLKKPFFKRLRLNFLSNKFVYFFYKKFIIDNLDSNDQLFDRLKKIKPDLIIYPSHCFEPEAYKIVDIAEKLKIKTLFIIDNWDNLSSKTVLFKKPSAITVWGDQTKYHAKNIHEIKDKNIYKIGNPKFDGYLSLRNQTLKNNFKFRYVIFLGILRSYQELKALIKLDKEITDNKKIYKDLKILYRPHPGKEIFIEKAKKLSLPNVVFDPHMEKYIKTNNASYLKNRNNYFEKLLSNSLFMVGCPTTVTIEALFFKKKQIYFCYPEKMNITDPKKVAAMTHFKYIDKISHLTKCEDLNKLPLIFRNFYKNKEYEKINKNLDREINYFYEISKKPYNKKLFSVVEKLI